MGDSWAPMRHDLRAHPKAAKAGPDAMWLFVCSVLWADLYETDGLVPHEAMPQIAAGLTGSKLKRAVGRLVAVGLWEPSSPDYRIHDYHEHQDSAEIVKARRAKAAERKRRQRAREALGVLHGHA